MADQPGGVFLRRAHDVAEDALLMLRATARVHIPCDGRSLRRILASAQVPVTKEEGVPELAAPRSRERRHKSWRVRRKRGAGAAEGQFLSKVPQRRRADRVEANNAAPLQYDNDYGGLTAENDYEIRVRRFRPAGLARRHWANATPIRTIFREAFARADLPYFNPHSFRKTLAQLGEQRCQTPEQFKAWSQNLGHEQVMTTFASYGSVSASRQAEIIRSLALEVEPDESVKEVARQLMRLNAGPRFPIG